MATVCLEDEVADLKCELTRLRAALVQKDQEVKTLRRLRAQRRKRRLAGLALDSGKIWGYARASTEKQDTSCEKQADLIRRKAVQLPGQLVRIYEDEAISGATIPWEERDGFRALMEVIGPGDHLIAWKFDRIDRNPFAMMDAARWLLDQQVHLHILAEQCGELNLDSAAGRSMLMNWAIYSDMFVDYVRRATSEGLQWRKERGLAHGQLELGKRRRVAEIPDPKRPGRLMQQKYDVWDPEDCAVIREIWRRHELDGEPLYRIAKDLLNRGVRQGNGRMWSHLEGTVRTYLRCKEARQVKVNTISRAYWLYTGMLACGQDLEELEPNPEHVARARERLELWRASNFRADCLEPSHTAVRRYWEWQKKQEQGNGQ